MSCAQSSVFNDSGWIRVTGGLLSCLPPITRLPLHTLPPLPSLPLLPVPPPPPTLPPSYTYSSLSSNVAPCLSRPPPFVLVSSSNRQIWEAQSWHASADLRILGLSTGLPFLPAPPSSLPPFPPPSPSSPVGEHMYRPPHPGSVYWSTIPRCTCLNIYVCILRPYCVY